jgi:hypothetical protein
MKGKAIFYFSFITVDAVVKNPRKHFFVIPVYTGMTTFYETITFIIAHLFEPSP